MKPLKRAGALLFACALASHALASGSDLYGKPLRGLSPVPLAEIAKSPERYRGKTIRVTGTSSAASASEMTLSEGGASLVVKADGFSLPARLDGARVTAEGRLQEGALAATGVEVSR
jgi:hypothetical protein